MMKNGIDSPLIPTPPPTQTAKANALNATLANKVAAVPTLLPNKTAIAATVTGKLNKTTWG